MDLRQHLAKFIAANGEEFGNWTSKQSLREKMYLSRAPKSVPTFHGGFDLARIAKYYPDSRRFYVVGCDIFQVPVFRVGFVLAR